MWDSCTNQIWSRRAIQGNSRRPQIFLLDSKQTWARVGSSWGHTHSPGLRPSGLEGLRSRWSDRKSPRSEEPAKSDHMNCESGDSSGARPTGDIWRVIICPICAAQPREGGRSWKWTAPREDSRCLITWRPAHKFQNAFETSDYVAKVWKMFGSLWLWIHIIFQESVKTNSKGHHQ